jgi:integron integrase
MAYKTEQNYCHWINDYARWLAKTRPVGDSRSKMESYLTMLAVKRDVAPSTQNQAFNALLFFYREVRKENLTEIRALRAKPRQYVRTAPDPRTTIKLLNEVKDRNGYPIRLITQMLYGCGLRVTEPLALRLKDIDLEATRLTIRQAKGGKDRVVALPPQLAAPLRQQMDYAAAISAKDKAHRIPVQLPNGLARKYPAARHSPSWAFLFPGHKPVKHPRTGEIVRWHLHEANIQRAVKEAAAKLGLEAVVTPHVLRHAYATHIMREGSLPRDVQAVMGHKNLETTMGYLHAEADCVKAPSHLANIIPISA